MEGEAPHKRRKRYRGSHPRGFAEKYKEHRSGDYQAEVERVIARGGTPAGSHRPICVSEVLAVLAPRPGETAVDLTLGHGGHARELLRAILPGGWLFGFDVDRAELARSAVLMAAALGEAGGEGAFVPVHANFARLAEVLEDAGLEGADIVLADLGASSMQLDDPERGFSWKRRGPLDMRMDQAEGPSARDWLAAATEEALARALSANADEVEALRVARAISLARGRLVTTRDLAEAICAGFPSLAWKDPAMTLILRRSFQAIRIEVNGEFASLDALLASLPSCLRPGGRAAFLSFHSGEDRRVSACLARGLEAGLFSSISGQPVKASLEERRSNPRSSSALLRWAVRAGAAEAGAKAAGRG